MNTENIINTLFDEFSEIRYVALYLDEELIFRQKKSTANSSSGDTDKFEELLVNPTLLTLATQRGNIDCGGLNYLIIGYGNFFQLVKSLPAGHISLCLEQNADLNILPSKIFDFLRVKYSGLELS
ncbi:MAG: hypothetical protein RLN81_07960 [Balneolaceae bacterium]